MKPQFDQFRPFVSLRGIAKGNVSYNGARSNGAAVTQHPSTLAPSNPQHISNRRRRRRRHSSSSSSTMRRRRRRQQTAPTFFDACIAHVTAHANRDITQTILQRRCHLRAFLFWKCATWWNRQKALMRRASTAQSTLVGGARGRGGVGRTWGAIGALEIEQVIQFLILRLRFLLTTALT